MPHPHASLLRTPPYHPDRSISKEFPSATAPEESANRHPSRLLGQVRDRLRRLGRAKQAEEAYAGWIHRFILANGKRHPETMGAQEVEAFLTRLAVRDEVAPSTQNQALAALLFLYREVLGRELPLIEALRVSNACASCQPGW